MKDTLDYLFTGNMLSKEDAQELMQRIGEGKFSEAEIASFLTVLRMRSVTSAEMAGFRQALLDLCVKIDFSDHVTIDVVGTGGDGKNTFNISTLSAFVLAGAGYKVTKHGNYGLSSNSGSSNMFEYFGYKFSNDQAKLHSELEKTGICFLHAPLFHPAMKHVTPVRKALKVKTLFNIMGPIINPSSPDFQLIGTYNLEILDLYSQALAESDRKFIIVHSLDGYDEVSLTGITRYASQYTEDILSPEDFGFRTIIPESIFGGNTVQDAAVIFRDILDGKGTEAQQNVVIANAALGIQCMFPDKKLTDCVAEASESLVSRKALQSFTGLIGMQK